MSDDGNTDFFPLRKASEPPDPPSYADGVRFYVDNDAVLRYVLPDGTDAAVGGSGGMHATYSGNPVAIADGATGQLTFDNLSTGVDLLDRTDPANPTFLTDGTYAVAVSAFGEDLTAAGYAILSLAEAPVVGEIGSAFTQETPYPGWSVAGTFIASAGDNLFATVYNNDGVSQRNFSILNAVIVKL